MANSINKYHVLPNEILEKIFINLDVNIIKQLNKDWRNFTISHRHKFTKINIDLLTAKIEDLKKCNPIEINVTCSRIYDIERLAKEMNDNYDSFREYIRSTIYKSLEEENNILKKIKTKLNIIRKYPSLKTINAKFDLINFSDDIEKLNEYFINGGVETNHIGHNTLSVFCIKLLLKSKAKNIYLTVENALYNKIKSFLIKTYSTRYEHKLKHFLIRNAHSFDKFIYHGTFNMFFLYDKNKKTFIHRVSDIAKYDKECWNVFYYIKPSHFSAYKLSHLIIYNNFIDNRFKIRHGTSKTYVDKCDYYYFVEDESIYLDLFKNSNLQSFNKESIKTSSLNFLILKKLKKFNRIRSIPIFEKFKEDEKSIYPFNLIIQKNDKEFDLKNTMLNIFKNNCPFNCCNK